MIFKRQVIFLIALSFAAVGAMAQDTGYVYRDTSIVSTETIKESDTYSDSEVAPDEDNSSNSTRAFIVDTTLVKNELGIPPDSVKALKQQKAFAYAKNLDSSLKALINQHTETKKTKEPGWVESIFLSNVTQYFFWMLAIVFIVFVITKLFVTEGFFQKSSLRKKVNILEQEDEVHQPNADYQSLANRAIAEKNYRLAIRYLYLQSLQSLSGKGLITFAPDKTNYEYVQELNGKSYKKDFASLTRDYEYAWYGEFDINEMNFQLVQNKFKQFNSILA